MPMPTSTNFSTGLSPAGASLGLGGLGVPGYGGAQLQDQVAGETEEERRRRMAAASLFGSAFGGFGF